MPDAGWYEDPGRPGLRWWDGERWTLDTAPLDTAPLGTTPPDPVAPDAEPLGGRAPAAAPLTPPADAGSRLSRAAAGRLPVILGVAAALVVIAVVVGLLAVSAGSHRATVTTRPTSPATAPNVAASTTTTTGPTATTVPGAEDQFETSVESGAHAVTGYKNHGSTLLGFGRTACAVLGHGAPAEAAWYGAVTPSPDGVTAVAPIAGASLVAAAARYLCPDATVVTRAARLATRVDALPVAFRHGGVTASADEAAAGITAYACDQLLAGSTPHEVAAELEHALRGHRYDLAGHEAGLATSVGIQVVCPAQLPAWLRDAGTRNL